VLLRPLFLLTALSAPTTRVAAQTDSLSAAIQTAAGHPAVARYLDFFQDAARDRMQQWLDRGAVYRGAIRERLARAGLPSEFEFLPMIESGYSRSARSRAGAVGMWQFLPETAREYGLRVDRGIDERQDPLLSTDAAIRHLGDLTRTFGSPLLAAAAYNGGAGRISRGLERLARTTDAASLGGDDFFALSRQRLIAPETRRYVPQLVAASIIGRDPTRFGFTVSPAEGQPPELPRLSPEQLRPVTARRGSLGSLIRVGRGDSLASLALRYQVSAAELRRVNALPVGYRLRPGQALRLPGT
jgi:membrane-bound lytic murein transglycosylase D